MHWFSFLLLNFVNTPGLFGDMTYPMPVQTCPINESAWRQCSDQLGCNDTYLYHCVPNNDLSSLVELCSMEVSGQSGHCLKLSIKGHMDNVNCDHFLSGCPNTSYLGHKLNQYPICLDIYPSLQCFTADVQCVKERLGNTSVPWTNVHLLCMGTLIMTMIICCTACLHTRKRCFKSEPEMAISQKLKQACREGNSEVYFNLIGVSANAEADKDGWNILHHAAFGGNKKIFQYLLEKAEMDVSKLTSNRKTVLHIAAQHGKIEICKLLKRSSAFPNLLNQKDCNQMSPVHVAARYGQLDILKLLEDSGFDPLEKVGTAQENIAMFSCIGGSLEVLTYIGNSPVYKYALYETNYEGWNVAHYAAKSGRCDMLEYLIGEMGVDGINESEKKKNCLHTACENGHYEACRYLLEKFPKMKESIDGSRKHAAHFAAMDGSVKIMKFLKYSGLPIENKDKENLSVLDIACQHARLDLCRYIIKEYPQLLNEETTSWNAALYTADGHGDEEKRIKIFDLLHKKGLNIYHVSGSGKTALYLASKKKSYKFVEHILKKYPNFHVAERAMDPIKAADGDKRIKALFRKYKDGNNRFSLRDCPCVIS